MAGELSRWIATPPVARERDRQVAIVRATADVAEARVMGIAEVAQVAMLGAGALSMTKRQLEVMAPEDAAKLEHLQVTAVMAMGAVLQRYGYQC